MSASPLTYKMTGVALLSKAKRGHLDRKHVPTFGNVWQSWVLVALALVKRLLVILGLSTGTEENQLKFTLSVQLLNW